MICLYINGGCLSTAAYETIAEAAEQMIRTKSRRLRIKRDSIQLEGELTTEYKSQVVGTFSGIHFSANLDIAKQTIKTEFIAPARQQDALCPILAMIYQIPLDGSPSTSPANN